MDDLISEFLIETNESLDALDSDFVELENNPEDMDIIGNIFRVMHTIKGTCGFLGLSRLERVAHAGENIMDKLRDGVFKANPEIISLILEANDRIKAIIEVLEETEAEPEGSDTDIIARLNACAESGGTSGNIDGATSAAEAPVTEAPIAADIEINTPDLDGEIDFTPVVADYANTDDAPTEAPIAADIEISTPDLDGEIDFTPVVADYANTDEISSDSNVPEIIAEDTISQQTKQEAVSTGLQVAGDVVKKKKAPATQSIRVNLDILENLMQMVGELVLTRNQLMQILRTAGGDSELNVPMQRLNHITSELQEGVMKTRMQPIGNAWAKFPRLVRDLSHDLNKKIELKMIGAETDLDRQMLEAIKDPLTHMVRNSADHGVEIPEKRLQNGKSEAGTITLSAYHEGGHIIIKIADDGNGLDLERIKAKALENEIVTEAELEVLSDKQIYQFIYKAGFSTAAEVTAVSGRGVGMDVVVNNIEKTGGHVEVNSWPGRGSEFLIKLPLTLAIMPVLIIQSGREIFAIPQIKVSEIVKINTSADSGGYSVETLNGAPVLRLRGKLLPLVSLAKSLNIARENLSDNDNLSKDGDDNDKCSITDKMEPFIVVCDIGSQTFGVLVDKVFHTEEIVVKPNSHLIKDLEVYAGCTILGDGSVIMILDPAGVISVSGVDAASKSDGDPNEGKLQNGQEEASFLTFDTWDKTPKAIPLELVSRLEEIKVSDIEWSGGNRVVQYRDGLMRLTSFGSLDSLPEDDMVEVVVFADEGRVMGLVVERIIDIVRTSMDIKMNASEQEIMGTLVINEVATDLVDISHFFSTAFDDWLTSKDAENLNGESSSSYKLLLVDDSPFFRKFMGPVLTVAGYDVTTAESAADGLQLLQDPDITFDIIVTDIDMPNMNGIEFAEKCTENMNYKNTPIIALSSHDESDLGEASELFNRFVSKANRNEVISAIAQVLTETQSQVA